MSGLPRDLYKQLLDEVRNLIKVSASLSPQELEIAKANSAFHDQLLEEVDMYADSVLQLHQDFKRIKIRLDTVNRSNKTNYLFHEMVIQTGVCEVLDNHYQLLASDMQKPDCLLFSSSLVPIVVIQ